MSIAWTSPVVSQPPPRSSALRSGSGDLLYQVEDRRPRAVQPVVEVLEGDTDIGTHPCTADLATEHHEIDQLFGRDLDVVAVPFTLVQPLPERSVERLQSGRHQTRVGHPGPL